MVKNWFKSLLYRIPIIFISKKELDYKEKEANQKLSNLEYNNKRLVALNIELGDKFDLLAPIVYGLKTKYDYKDELIYITTTVDSRLFMEARQWRGSLDYIADMISHSLRREISTINLARLPDYCRRIKEYRTTTEPYKEANPW
jgi:hypothetical protein